MGQIGRDNTFDAFHLNNRGTRHFLSIADGGVESVENEMILSPNIDPEKYG